MLIYCISFCAHSTVVTADAIYTILDCAGVIALLDISNTDSSYTNKTFPALNTPILTLRFH